MGLFKVLFLVSTVFMLNSKQVEAQIGEEWFQQIAEATAVTYYPDKEGTVGVALCKSEIESLKAFLLNDRNYLWGMNRRSPFIPKGSLQFGSEGLRIVLSLQTLQLKMEEEERCVILELSDAEAREIIESLLICQKAA